MSRTIRFKLSGAAEKLALAFQRHCNEELGLQGDLNHFVRAQFLKFLLDNVDKPNSDPASLAEVGVSDASGEADDQRDPVAATEQSDSTPPPALADSSTGDGPSPSEAGDSGSV